jgi:hypothetical protein
MCYFNFGKEIFLNTRSMKEMRLHISLRANGSGIKSLLNCILFLKKKQTLILFRSIVLWSTIFFMCEHRTQKFYVTTVSRIYLYKNRICIKIVYSLKWHGNYLVSGTKARLKKVLTSDTKARLYKSSNKTHASFLFQETFSRRNLTLIYVKSFKNVTLMK